MELVKRIREKVFAIFYGCSDLSLINKLEDIEYSRKYLIQC